MGMTIGQGRRDSVMFSHVWGRQGGFGDQRCEQRRSISRWNGAHEQRATWRGDGWVKADFSITFKDAGTLEEAWLAYANGGEYTGRRGRRERAKRLRTTQRTVIEKLIEGMTQTEAVSERVTVGTQTEIRHDAARTSGGDGGARGRE